MRVQAASHSCCADCPAAAGLTKIAAANHTRLPLEPLADAPKPAGGKLRIGDILKDKHISRRFFILAYVWMVMCMTYYGISFALGSLGGSLYISFAIGAIAEVGTRCLQPGSMAAAGAGAIMNVCPGGPTY